MLMLISNFNSFQFREKERERAQRIRLWYIHYQRHSFIADVIYGMERSNESVFFFLL